MRILIIGGTGTISTAITRRLLANGADLTLYNRGNTPVPGVKVITGNRYDHSAFEAHMAAAGEFECVIDMIAYHPGDVRSALRTFAGRVTQYIFCSTVDVYAKAPHSYPIREDHPREANPEFQYAYEKIECELLLEEAAAGGAFALTILRPAATYQDAWTPIPLIGSGPAWLKRVRDGKPIIILGDGTSFWTSSHREDVGAAFVEAIGNTKAYGKAYNVSGDEWLTWEDYYRTAGRVMDAPPLQLVPIPADLLRRMAPRSAEWCALNFKFNNIFDNSAAKTDLGYRYTITWEEGVRRMLAYHQTRGSIEASQPEPLYDHIVEAWERFSQSLVEELAPLDNK